MLRFLDVALEYSSKITYKKLEKTKILTSTDYKQ